MVYTTHNPFATAPIKLLLGHRQVQRNDRLRSVFAELQNRTAQMRRLYDWASPIETRLQMPVACIEDGYLGSRYEMMVDLEIYLECFYMFAFRWIDIARFSHSRSCLGCDPLASEPEAITKIRNNLIVHPERPKTELFTLSFGVDSAEGARIRPGRKSDGTEDHVFDDPGFQKNVAAMGLFIRNWSQACLAHLDMMP